MERFAAVIASFAWTCLCLGVLALPGCTTNRPMTDEGIALAVRIAVRHAVADSPRASEKAANIRAVVIRLQAIATSDSTVTALKAEVISYLDTLELSELERADALDVLDYFAAIMESQLGEADADTRLIKIQEFLRLVLAAVPASVS